MAPPELSGHPDWQSTLPPHCLRGTPGQRKIPETALRDPLDIEHEPQDNAALAARDRCHRRDLLVDKNCFDVLSNYNVLHALVVLHPHDIVVYRDVPYF